jgi:hypothetical protein
MNKIFLLCNNLLDSSRIKEVLSTKELVIVRNVEKLKSLSIANDDTVLLDYYFYENLGINSVIEHVGGCNNVISFVAHEKIDALKLEAPNIIFVARSRFFKNIAKYIVF